MFKGKEIILKVVDVRCRIVTLKFEEGKKKGILTFLGNILVASPSEPITCSPPAEPQKEKGFTAAV